MIDTFFAENQKQIKALVSERRDLFGIVDKYPLYKVTPNSIHRLIDWDTKKNRPIIEAIFFTDKRVAYTLFSPNIVDSHLKYSERAFGNLSMRFDTGTFTPAGGEQQGRRVNEVTWTAARDAATSGANGTTVETASIIDATTYYNYRAFQPFDTSSLGGSPVTSSSWQGYRDDTLEIGGNGFMNANTTTAEIVVSTEADPTSYAAADYSRITFASKGSLAFASTSNNAYNIITITDQTIISLTGYTKLCLITGRDLNNSAPTGYNTLSFQNRSQANPPKLVIIYTSTGDGAYFM